MAPPRRLLALSIAVAVLASTCGTDGTVGASSDAPVEDELIEVDQVASTERENLPSALDDPAGNGLPAPIVDLDRLVSGGPPPDGIPAIDRPLFHTAHDVDFLDDREPVVAIEI